MTIFLKMNSNLLKDFDEITKFRIINMYYVTISICLLTPSIAQLKGELLAAWVISIFLLFEQLTVKLNRYLVTNFTISQLFKCGSIIHILYTLGVLLYWYDPLIMLLWDMTLALMIMGIFNSYSIQLNTYLTNNFPHTMTEFQLVRNTIASNAYLIGLGIGTIIAYFGGVSYCIFSFFVFNLFFTINLLRNWTFFDKLKNI